jgi:PKD repeat protein
MKSKSMIWVMAGVVLLFLCIAVVPVSATTADFSVSPTSGTAPLPVTFSDLSNCGASCSYWTWQYAYSINPGSTWTVFSDVKNPSQTFGPGTYDIQLKVAGPSGPDYDPGYKTVSSYITVSGDSTKGSITVTSNPSGARVYIDDTAMTYETPFTYYDITPGYHKVQVAEYYTSQTFWIEVTADTNIPLNVDLTGTPTFTSITPNSGTTSGGTPVTIIGSHFVDKGWAGGTPLSVSIGGATATIIGSTDGTHIDASTAAHASGAYDVVITNGGDTGHQSVTGTGAYAYVAEPPTTGSISVSSTPTGALVFIDGNMQSFSTPYTFTGITPGHHDVRVSKNYLSQTHPVTVTAGEVSAVTAVLDGTPTFNYIFPNSGSIYGSESVTIAGSNFIDGPSFGGGNPLSVTIGGAPADVELPTDGTYIYVTTPPGTAGLQPVVITNGGYDGSGSQVVNAGNVYTYQPPTVASFTAAPRSGPSPLYVVFTDTSTGESTASWTSRYKPSGPSGPSGPWTPFVLDAGNGKTFNGVGTYDISLEVTGPSGPSGPPVSTKTELNYIVVSEGGPVASFTASPEGGDPPLFVQFTDTSTGFTDPVREWYFYDPGESVDSTIANPTHTFTTAGEYWVELGVRNSDCPAESDACWIWVSNVIMVNAPPPGSIKVNWEPAADSADVYVGEDHLTGTSPQTFTDITPGTYTVQIFGNGVVDSSEAQVTSNHETQVSLNIDPAAVLARFTADYYNFGCYDVQYSAYGSRNGNNYEWYFGDGSAGNGFTVYHPYASTGPHDVTLTVTGPSGSNTLTRTIIPPTSSLAIDSNPQGANIGLGEGGEDTGWKTPHTFACLEKDNWIYPAVQLDGYYNARHDGYAPDGSAQSIFFDLIPAGTITAIPESGIAPLAVQFTYYPSSSLDPFKTSTLIWNFGDDSGYVYAEDSVSHTYAASGPSGPYTVILTGYNAAETLNGQITKQITVQPETQGPPPTVTKITPNVGSDKQSSWPVTIEGTDFAPGDSLRVYLAQGEGDPIEGIDVSADSTQIECDFDLSDAAPGSYTVWVENPDGQEGSLTNGFTVVSESALSTAQYNRSTEVLYAGPQMNGGEEVKTSCLDFNVPDYEGQLFFKDPTPEANWEKPVIFYYVETVQSHAPRVTKYDSCSPPTNIDMPLVDGHPWAPDGSGPAPISLPATPPAQCTGGFAANRYALLISGGQDKTINYVRYLKDLQSVYDKLTNTYCYDPDKIYVLYSDGKTSGTDTLEYYGQPSAYTPTYTDTSWSAITDDADRASLDAMLTSLRTGGSRVLPSTAKLLIYVDNHGASTGNLKLWGSSASITPSDFVSALPTQVDTIMMVMQQCYSGAFITPFTTATWSGGNQNQKRYIMTAATSSQYSYGNAFATAWISAITNGCPPMKTSFTNAANGDAAKASETPTDGQRSGTDPTTLYLADSCAPASITVKTPNGGESWQQGTSYQYPITWSQTGLDSADTVKIELWTVGGSTPYKTITSSTSAISGIFGVANIPATYTAGSNYLIKITCNQHSSATDTSNAAFSITAAGNKGSFTIKSTPVTGADVYIDGIKQSSKTDTAAISGIPVGVDHKVRIEKTNYYSPEGTYKLTTNGESQTITLKLVDAKNDEPPYVWLAIESEPPGAQVKIHDMQTMEIDDTGMKTPGRTPVYTDPLDPLAMKQYEISVSLDGYYDPDPIVVNVNKNWVSDVPVQFTFVEKPKVPVKTLIVPNPLNLGRTGYFLALVKVPTGYKAADVKAGSVYCEGAPALKLIRTKLLPQIFIAIFSRQDLGPYPTGSYNMNVKGLVMKNGAYEPFLGSDKVNIINIKVTTKEDVDSVMTMSDTQIFTKFNKL